MSLYESNDACIFVPQHISKYGIYTSHMFILTACHAFYYDNTSLGCMLILFYISNVTNWAIIHRKSIVKQINIILGACILTKISLYDSNRFQIYKDIWFHSLYIIISIFIMSEYIFYNKIYNTKSKIYCIPNTLCREYAYYMYVFIHVFFVHLIFPIFTSYYVILSQ